LNNTPVDLLLLDINMPGMTGLDLLKTLKNPPMVVFTTAYSEYGAASYDYNAIDYLVKPIPFERFMLAMNKVREVMQRNGKTAEPEASDKDVLFVKTEGKLVRIDVRNIWFVEGLKDYLRIWTDDGKIIVHSTMKNMEQQLSTHSNLVRVHKSYIANISNISEIDGNLITIKGQQIVIGATYKDEVYRRLEELRLL
jgi:DNA-binding LytR/AlgR family response regulator